VLLDSFCFDFWLASFLLKITLDYILLMCMHFPDFSDLELQEWSFFVKNLLLLLL